MRNLNRIARINSKAVQLSSSIKLLGNLVWPVETQDEFLKSYSKGQVFEPKIQYKKVNYGEERRTLTQLLNSFTADDPLEVFTKNSIESYIETIDLNHSIGTHDFTELSKKIFGTPGDLLPGSTSNIIDSAKKLVDLAADFTPPFLRVPSVNIEAEAIKSYMDRRIQGVFKGQGPKVIITEELVAKATATSTVVRLKPGANFTNYDFKQLFYHEVMTHSLTALNGEEQNILKCMRRSSPRTLKTQEGLATFSEVITGAMDIQRLKRLALRILATDAALNGANFREVFEYFLSRGQGEVESYNAAYRIFRGGFPDKNIVFTKDCIYLEGLINVHTLFRWAMKHNKLDICHLLFCGKLSIEDVFQLEDAYNYQWIVPPKYLPGWFQKIEGLAGTLSFSLLANLVRIDVADETFYRAS